MYVCMYVCMYVIVEFVGGHVVYLRALLRILLYICNQTCKTLDHCTSSAVMPFECMCMLDSMRRLLDNIHTYIPRTWLKNEKVCWLLLRTVHRLRAHALVCNRPRQTETRPEYQPGRHIQQTDGETRSVRELFVCSCLYLSVPVYTIQRIHCI